MCLQKRRCGLIIIWLHFGYILVTYWIRVCIGFEVLCLQGIVMCEVGSQEGDNQEVCIAQCDKSKPNLCPNLDIPTPVQDSPPIGDCTRRSQCLGMPAVPPCTVRGGSGGRPCDAPHAKQTRNFSVWNNPKAPTMPCPTPLHIHTCSACTCM